MRTYNCVTLHSLPSVVTHSYPHSHPVSYVAIDVVEVMRKLMLREMSIKLEVSTRKWQSQKPTPRLLWTQPSGPSLLIAFLSQQTGTNIGWHSHNCALCPVGTPQTDFSIASKSSLLPAGLALEMMKSHLLFKNMDPVPLLTPFH